MARINKARWNPDRFAVHRSVRLLLTFLFGSVPASLVGQANPAVQPLPRSAALPMEITPDSVALTANIAVPVVVRVFNAGEHPLSDLTLTWFSEDSIHVSAMIDSATVDSLASTDMHAWSVRVVRHDPAAVAGSIHFRLDYLQHRAAADPPVRRTSLATLRTRNRATPPWDSVATIEVKSTLGALSEHRSGLVHLIVQNRLDVPLYVGDVVTSGRFVTFETIKGVDSIPANTSASLTLEALAEEAVQPGRQTLLFEVPVEWVDRSARHASNIIVTYDVGLEVFGESELLGVLGTVGLGVPSFLLLPGILMLITFSVLWRSQLLMAADTNQSLSKDGATLAKMPEFWVAAITLSGIMAIAYPRLFGGRFYLEGYSLEDVASIWMISVLVGLGGYLVVGLIVRGRQSWSKRADASRTPGINDDVLETLRKLGRNNLKLALPQWSITDGGSNGIAFDIGGDASADPVWVCPMIELEYLGVDQKAEQEIEKLLHDQTDPGELAEVLATAVEARHVRVRYAAVGIFQGPARKARSALKAPNLTALIAQRK